MSTPQFRPLERIAIRRAVRSGVAGTLNEKGRRLSRRQIDAMLAEVSNDAIDDATDRALAAAPPASQLVVGGPVLDWIAAHQDLIAAIVKLVLAALGVA